jgi:gliding motility-associated-like protein
MQVVVSTSCVGSAPTAGGAAAVCGGGGALTVDYQGPSVTQVDANSFVMCPDDSLCFTIPFADIDGDNVTIITNIGTSIPTANFTINGNGTQNASLSFCWIPTSLDSGVNVITIQVSDDACPISATQYYTYDITIFDQPYAGENQIICGAQTANLQALGGGDYVWSVISGDTDLGHLSCTNCDYVTVDPDITTTYLLTSGLAAACDNTDTVTVFVVPDFTPVALGDTTLCDYLTKELGVSIAGPAGTYGFVWDNIATLNDNTIQNPIASPLQSTNYIVEVTSPDGCVKIDSTLILLVPPADLNIYPIDTTICLGEVVNFGIDASCQETATVTGQDNSSGTIATISSFNCVPSGATVTSVTLDASFTGAQCPNWYSYDIIINGITQFTQQCNQTNLDLSAFLPITSVSVSANDEDSFGDNVTLNLTLNLAYTNNQLSYSWSPTTFLSNPLIPNPVLTGLDSSKVYTVTITDTASNCSFDRPITVSMFDGFGIFTSPTDTTICQGQQVELNVEGFVSNCEYVVWLHDSWGDGWNSPAQVDILINGVVYLAGQTVPSCSGSECEVFLTIPVTTGDVITLNYTTGSFNSENSMAIYDADGNEVFSVNNPNAGIQTPVIAECSGGVVFSWMPNNNLSDPTLPNPVFNGLTSGVYVVEVSLDGRPECYELSDSITIIVDNLGQIDITGDSAVCFGSPVTYTISGADSIIWPDNSFAQTYTYTPLDDDVLTVTAVNYCGNITLNKHVVVYPEINLLASPDTIICDGEAVTLNLAGVLDECTYLLTLIDSAGNGWGSFEGVDIKINGVLYESGVSVLNCGGTYCTTSMVIPINDGDVLTLEYTSGATDIENTIQLFDASNAEVLNITNPTAGVLGTFNTSCNNAYDITWSPSTQLSDATVINPVFSGSTSETLGATVSLNANPNCSGISNTIYLDVRPIDVPDIIGDSVICIGTTVSLNINADSVLWWGDTTNVSTTFTFTPQQDSLVTATATTFCVKNAVTTHYVVVNPLPVITSINDTTITIQDVITLTTTGGEIYTWIPSTYLSCSDCPSPEAAPEETTLYEVIVTDSNGCVSSRTINVEVLIPDLFIPNGFSPNGDGVNDLVEVRSLSIETMNIKIFDRWGGLIFESNDQAISWDGTFNGTNLDAGVYVYKFESKMVDGAKIEKSGTITLFR